MKVKIKILTQVWICFFLKIYLHKSWDGGGVGFFEPLEAPLKPLIWA